MTTFKIGDIVKGEDDGKNVYGYILTFTDKNPKDPYVIVRWFDGYEDTNSSCKAMRKVTELEDLDRIEDW